MKKTAAHSTTTNLHSGNIPSLDALSIGRELLDTTWRITTPVLLFAVGGILADRHFGTKPWVTLSGVVIGFVFATILVKQQITASEAKDAANEEQQ